MNDNRKGSDHEKDGGADDSDVRPVAPPMLQHVKWLLLHGKRHKTLIVVAALALAIGGVISTDWGLLFAKRKVDSAVDTITRQAAIELRSHFRHARDTLALKGTADFSDVQKDVDNLFKLDRDNGHAFYYSGEMRRVAEPLRFTSKSCPKTPLAQDTTIGDFYHDDFYRYLEHAAGPQVTETSGDTLAEVCYQLPAGYCPQRTAWIHHLLANDFYAEAMASTNPSTKAERLRRAVLQANDALRLFPGGFEQCVPTVVIAHAQPRTGG